VLLQSSLQSRTDALWCRVDKDTKLRREDSWDRPDASGNDGNAAGERLQYDIRPSFLPAREASDIGGRVIGPQLLIGDTADKAANVGAIQLRSQVPKVGKLWAGSYELELATGDSVLQ